MICLESRVIEIDSISSPLPENGSNVYLHVETFSDKVKFLTCNRVDYKKKVFIYLVNTIGNIFPHGCATRENITEDVHSMK